MLTHTRGLFAAAAVLLSALFATGAGAQGPVMTQVTLTTGIVEAFMASYPTVRETSDNLSAQYGVNTDDGDNPAAGWQAWLQVSAAQNALNAACQGYGFQDFQQWMQVFVSVATAYAFAREGGMDTQMGAALAQIQNNPNLSPAQKQMMIQQMQAAMGVVTAMMPPQENLDAVTPYIGQLAILFEDA